MAKMKISYELDMHEDASDIKAILNAHESRDCLCEIDELLRQKIKHGAAVWLEYPIIDFLESLREIVSSSRATHD